MSNSFRYNGKTCKKEGIHSDFMKSLLIGDWFHYDLNLPKPINNSEISLLSEFIFGRKLTVRIEQVYDSFQNKLMKDEKFKRLYKLNMLSEKTKDYFNGEYYGKKPLLYFSYECKQIHDNYYDSKFNRKVFKSSYEMDNSFWKHCVGDIYCGGIADHSYGQVKVTSLKERERLLNIINNPTQKPRQEFIDELDKLKELDKEYDKVKLINIL